MNLLELVILAHRCRSTHHFIAFDALQLLKGKHAADWKNLLLKHHTDLLKGAKAPDTTFKDFQNHVLHVEEGEWGGARDAAMAWYGKAVEALREQKWAKAAYALGVLTHYYADPIQPFHTAQSEEEGAIHRAMEWSIAKSRDTIKALIDQRGYPQVSASSETGFVADMVLAGAKYSNPHYQTFIDHYDLHKGVANPTEGLDQTLLDILADLIAYATAGVALLFERAIAEAGVKPKKVDLDLPGYFAALDIPIRRITKRMSDAKDRKTVEAMYKEFTETGKVVKTLPADDKKIRALHCKHILRKPLEWLDAMPIKPLGTKHVPLAETPQPVRYELKVVPVPIEVDPQQAFFPRTPTIAADPEVFDEEVRADQDYATSEAAETQAASTEQAAPMETAKIITLEMATLPDRTETTTPAEAMLAELDAAQAEAATETETETETEATEATTESEDPGRFDASEPEPDAAQDETPSAKALTLDSPVVDAPSIGPKTAARLGKVQIETIGELLAADAEATATALNVRYIKPATLRDWQDQTRLMVEAPGLRVLDSQILVGAGIRSVNDLAEASATTVLKAATSFLDTPKGARVLWGGENNVDQTEVEHWIDLAKAAQA
ncbi:MAG: DUF4332 domain-containing protein [Pseudomonadota bacterium]